MNGAHDLGGMQGFGPVIAEIGGPLFHAEWERRVLAVTLAMGALGEWNLDMSRSARESVTPVQYLSHAYYEIWFEGLKMLVIRAGLASLSEIRDGQMRIQPKPVTYILKADQVPAALQKGKPTLRKAEAPPRFAVGESVVTRQINPTSHTRLPRYCRGRRGTITKQHGAHVFPDTHATGHGEQPQWLYTVGFDAHELWGPDTTASAVHVDCWESYLQARE